jgi:hypothetical protein
LHLVGCLYYLYFIIYFLRLAKQSQFIPLQNVVYFISLPFMVRKIFTFYINDVQLFKCDTVWCLAPKPDNGQSVAFELRQYLETFAVSAVSLVNP